MFPKITKEQSDNMIWARNKMVDRFIETHEISDEKKYNNNMLSDLDYFNQKHRIIEEDGAIISFTYDDTIENEWNFIYKKKINENEYMILLIKTRNVEALKKDFLDNSPSKSKKVILKNLNQLIEIMNESDGFFIELQDDNKVNIFKIIKEKNIKTLKEVKLLY